MLFHGLRSEDPNQHLKDFLKLVDSLDLDVANRERMRLCLFQFSHRDQASNWLERLPAVSISTWEDPTTRFLAQFFPPGRTAKLRNDILIGPHDTQYCMENPDQAFVEYASSRTNEAGGKWYTFKPEQNNLGDTYNPSWKSHLNLSQSNLEGLVSKHVPQAYAEVVYSNPHPRNLNELPKQNPFTFRERTSPNPQPQALETTFEARVRDYMAGHTERMERLENVIFKQREDINDRMT
ncbi:MAK10-like protein [Tanacetum coccineum]